MPKFNSVDTIPAKVFFDILKTKDFQQLKPKPKEKGLDGLFMAIYDDFFLRSDNEEAKEYLRLTNEIRVIEHQINILKQSLHFYLYNRTTLKMRLDYIEALKIGYGIEIDAEADFLTEVQRILNFDVGFMMNDLTMLKTEYDDLIKQSKGKDYDYYDKLVGLSNILLNNSLVREEMTLAVYISLEKLAKKQQTKKVA